MIPSSPLLKAVSHRGKWLRLAIVMASAALSVMIISAFPIEALVLQNPSNGHFYEFVPGYLTWSEAQDAAVSRSHLGLPGYLATITSQSEQTFIEQLLDGVSIPPIDDFPQIWIGGNDADQEGLWRWVTGPEAGTPFWQGDVTGSPVEGAYENWGTLDGAKLQPDELGNEDFLSIQFNPTPGSFPSDGKYDWNDSRADRIGVGYVVEYSEDGEVTEVKVDIKPDSFPNSINPKSNGVIPVAILTTDAFDATTVDPLSVRFGPNGAEEAHHKGHIEDVNHDGEPDLVLHFQTQATGIQCGQTSASLTGETFDGDPIQGSDTIETVGCKK
jgi:hypothetical protein